MSTAGVDRAGIGPVRGDLVPLARADLASVEVDGEIVLYDDRQHRLHRLNPTAATLWRCLDGTGTFAQIADDIADVYQADRQTVLADILSLAEEFAAEGLLAGVGTPDDGDSGRDTQSRDSDAEDDRFVSELPSPCMDPKFPLGEEGMITVRAGQRFLGLRVNTPELAAAARQVLAPAAIDGVEAPPNVSIAETQAKGGRPLYFCYRSGYLLARARSVKGALSTAVALLSTYDQPIEYPSGPLVRLNALLAVDHGVATLISPESRALLGLAPRLQASGFRIDPRPWVLIDPVSGEVVVRPIAVTIDGEAFAALKADPHELPPPSAGRYPVGAWIAATANGLDTTNSGGRLTQLAALSPDLKHNTNLVVQALSKVLERTAWKVPSNFDATALTKAAGA